LTVETRHGSDSDAIGVIINPISGAYGRPDAGARRAELAARLLAQAGAAGRVAITRHCGHARELARELLDEGCTLVVAWGGDGTINEVASVLVERRRGALGIVPAGSGNGLARELGISRRPEEAIASALGGCERRIDAAELGGHLLFNVAGIGLDAEIARRVNLCARGRRGAWPYVKGTLAALAAARSRRYTISASGITIAREAIFVSVANGTQYGIGARIAPRALLDDGLADVVVVEGTHALGDLWRARRLFTGAIARDPRITTVRTALCTIEADQPMTYHVDGEVFEGGSSLSCAVQPGVLRVRVPRPAREHVNRAEP
jgi:YegS/Rv2252/BmrU family lipid kinase